MSKTKPVEKYEVVPTLEQLMALVEYFQKYSEKDGNIYLTQKHMLKDPIITPYFGSSSYLNGVNSYLTNEGYINKISIGSRHQRTQWDVSRILNDWDNIPTREDVGHSRPTRDSNNQLVKTGVEVVRSNKEEPVASEEIIPEEVETPDTPSPEPKSESTTQDNREVIHELKQTMSDMMGYLQNLPIEMGGHLQDVSNKLDLADANALTNLQKTNQDLEAQKKDLSEEVQRLKTELEEVGGKVNYSKHQVYRQRNLIMDEVDRMINEPAWQIRKNKNIWRQSIEKKMDAIMKEIGIDEAE